MPPKYYAVARGREGPAIYTSWDQCTIMVSRYPAAKFKSFKSIGEAETWLASALSLQPQPVIQAANRSTLNDYSRMDKPYSRVDRKSPIIAALPLAPVPPTPANSAISLSNEQKAVLDRVLRGENVFFSGSAGTGKSVLLRAIIDQLGGRASQSLGITAPTGIAGVNINGCTLHSWAGIGIGNETAKKLAGKFLGQPKCEKVLERWQNVRTLIIDEISMVDGALFDKLEEIARIVRKNNKPFGGIQLVLSGDFFQLPPVPNRVNNVAIKPTFAFDANTWGSCVGRPVNLTRVFRQKDQAFVDILNDMRFGHMQNVDVFYALAREVKYSDNIEPTELSSTRAEVELVNSSRLNRLPGDCHTYEAREYPGVNSNGERVSLEQMARLLDRLVVPQRIRLKVGAQVMLVKNLVQGRLVNGSVGQIIGFFTSVEAIQRRLEIAKVTEADGKPRLPPTGKDQLWPLVRFSNGNEVFITPEEFTVNNADGGMEARRDQVPLILAWALSVHKSQGQTIERVRVDMKKTFEHGQAYVAVSRATNMESLQILNFQPSKVLAHPRVLEWYEEWADQDNHGDFEDEMDSEAAMEAYYG